MTVYPHHLHAADTLITVGELEQLAIHVEHISGLTPADATRPMHPWEIRAGVNFAEMDRTLTVAQQRTTSSLDELRDAVIAALIYTLTHAASGVDAQRALTEFAASQPESVRKAIATASEQIQETLDALYTSGADEVIREAVKQGAKPADALVEDGLEPEEDQFQSTAAVAPTSLWAALLAVAVKAGGARTVDASTITDLVTAASIAGPYDLARQSTNIAHGLGRQAAANADGMPTPISVFASELLDGATCDPCEQIDGYEYVTLDEAYLDYPDAGPYIRCDGGDRCRGTLLFIFNEEPTVDDPGQ